FKESFILSLDGKIIATDKNLKARGYKAGDSFYFNQKDQEMIKTKKHSTYSQVYTYDGVKLMTGYGPIYKDHDPTKEIIALMAINFDASIINERTMDTITAPFIMGIIVFLLAAIAVFIFIYWMIKPIARLSVQVNKVAAGDLTIEPLLLTSKDEVGRLARDFGAMTSNLRKLITEVNDTSTKVSVSAHDLSISAEETGKASEQTVNITLDLTAGAEKQLTNLEENSKAFRDMSASLAQIAENAENVSLAAAKSSTVAQEGGQAIMLSNQQMNTMDRKISDLSTIIKDLSGLSQEIKNILEIITNIAAETNLLALNASIEAARAGDHGRGLGVVASSIRKLSERSTTSANQISELIALTVKQMELAAETMADTAVEVAYGSQLVRSAGQAFTDIEHSAIQTATAIEEVTGTVRILSINSENLVQSLEVLVGVANVTVEGAQNMSAVAQEQLAAMEEVDASATLLSGLSEKLHLLIERFKV
ncbi:MAG: methyl-accepting chemotaxis protein, partial [Gorillibacterium sp.]|nr:methyl-accepting chemotaxis protein [Gorillibacterium sp.]